MQAERVVRRREQQVILQALVQHFCAPLCKIWKQLCQTCYIVFIAILAKFPGGRMAEQDELSSVLSTLSSVPCKLAQANARLDADCTTVLSASDLGACRYLPEGVFDIGDRLRCWDSLPLSEAMSYMRMGFCELLLSLLRRLPWKRMKHKRAVAREALALLPYLLSSLHAFLCVARKVRSTERASAFAEMTKRCSSQICGAPGHVVVQEPCPGWTSCTASCCLFCACLPSSDTLCSACRYEELRVREGLADIAASLVEVARKVATPDSIILSGVGLGLVRIQEVGHPGSCIYPWSGRGTFPTVLLAPCEAMYVIRRWCTRPTSAHPHDRSCGAPQLQKSCVSVAKLQRASRFFGWDELAAAEEWSLSSPAACLLLSRFLPATAELYVEFRRLRGALPPNEELKFAEGTEKELLIGDMLITVRLGFKGAADR